MHDAEIAVAINGQMRIDDYGNDKLARGRESRAAAIAKYTTHPELFSSAETMDSRLSEHLGNMKPKHSRFGNLRSESDHRMPVGATTKGIPTY